MNTSTQPGSSSTNTSVQEGGACLMNNIKNNTTVQTIVSTHRAAVLDMYQSDGPASQMVVLRMKNMSSLKSAIAGDESQSSNNSSLLQDMLVKSEGEAMELFQIITSHRDEALVMFKADTPASKMISLRVKNVKSMKDVLVVGESSLISTSVLQEHLVKSEEDAMKLFEKELLASSTSSSMLGNEMENVDFGNNNDGGLGEREERNTKHPPSSGITHSSASMAKISSGSNQPHSQPNKKKEASPTKQPNKKDQEKPANKLSCTSSPEEKMHPFNQLNGSIYHSVDEVYEARIKYQSQYLYLGRYKLSTDAAHAHDKASRLLDGIPDNKINFATSDDYLTMRNMELQQHNINVSLDDTMIKLDSKVKEVVKKVNPDVNAQDMSQLLPNASEKERTVLSATEKYVRIVELVMKSNKSFTELRNLGKSDVGNIVRPTLRYADKHWKQIRPLLQKAIDAKEEGKTIDRDSLLRLFNTSNKDTKPKATSSRKASVKEPSRSTISASSSTQVETLSVSAQDPTSRRSIRKRSAPELFVARPSKFSGGVEEGDEEFLAAFTLTDLRKSSSNSSQQSKHPSYYLLQEASVLFSGINETNAAQTFQSIDCLFSKGTQRDKNSRWKALKELHSKHPSYHLLESQRALNKTQKPTKKVASKKMMEKKSASLSEGDSSDNKATTTVNSGLKDCTELGPGWKVEMVSRKKGERKDKYYYSTTGERFRSLVQARASMNDMEIDNDDTMEIDSDDESVEDSGKTNAQFFGHELFGPQLLKTKYESLIPIGAHGNKLSLGTFILASDAALAFDKASKLLNKNVPSSRVKQNFAHDNDHIEMRNKEMSVRGLDNVDLKDVMSELSSTLNGIMSKIETPTKYTITNEAFEELEDVLSNIVLDICPPSHVLVQKWKDAGAKRLKKSREFQVAEPTQTE